MKIYKKLYRKFFKIILIIIVLYSCSNNKYNVFQQDKFDYSYNCFFDTSFSFSIYNQDTITVYQECCGEKLDFKAILSKKDKEQINNWLNEINFDLLDTLYANYGVEDGESYSFKIYNPNYSKSIEVINSNSPVKLKQLSDKMLIFKRRLFLKALKNNSITKQLKNE